MAILTNGLSKLWLESLSGNPNFSFFQTIVFYGFWTAKITEGIKNFAKSKFDLDEEEGEKNKLNNEDD